MVKLRVIFVNPIHYHSAVISPEIEIFEPYKVALIFCAVNYSWYVRKSLHERGVTITAGMLTACIRVSRIIRNRKV